MGTYNSKVMQRTSDPDAISPSAPNCKRASLQGPAQWKQIRAFRHHHLKRVKGTAVQSHGGLPTWCLCSPRKSLRNKKKHADSGFLPKIHDSVDLR